MAETIGAKLRTARQTRGLSVEDAAHATRIHANNIRGLENDDYSGFANITYAKSFLNLYSRYLEVDAADALAQFSSGDVSSSAGKGRTFLQPVAERIVSGPRPSMFETRPPAEIASPGGTPILLGLVLLLLLIAIPTLWYLGKDAKSPEEVTTKLKEFTASVLDENHAAAVGDPKIEPAPADSDGTAAALAALSGSEPSPAQPEPKQESARPKKSAPLQAKPLSPAATRAESDPAPDESGADRASADRPDVESGERPRQPPARPVTSSPEEDETEPVSPPAETQPAAPIRATPLIARPMVIPDPAEEQQNTGADNDSPADSPEDEARRNRYPRPE